MILGMIHLMMLMLGMIYLCVMQDAIGLPVRLGVTHEGISIFHGSSRTSLFPWYVPLLQLLKNFLHSHD